MWLFRKFILENFVKNFFLVISVNYCWRHYFLTKVILWNWKFYILWCNSQNGLIFGIFFCIAKWLLVFLGLFSAICFLCILLTQLVFWYFFYFEFIFLCVCKSWCITTLYCMYSHFLVHKGNKNTRKIKFLTRSVKYTTLNNTHNTWKHTKTLLVQQLRIDTFLTNIKRVKTDIYNSYRKLFLL